MVKYYHVPLEDKENDYVNQVLALSDSKNKHDFLLLTCTCFFEKLLAEGLIKYSSDTDGYIKVKVDNDKDKTTDLDLPISARGLGL